MRGSERSDFWSPCAMGKAERLWAQLPCRLAAKTCAEFPQCSTYIKQQPVRYHSMQCDVRTLAPVPKSSKSVSLSPAH